MMNKAASIPKSITEAEGWWCEVEEHKAGSAFPAHYHEMDEWLSVTDGDITFTDTSGRTLPIVLSTGDCLEIPAGDVHSVRVGPSGAKYAMWTPQQTSSEFMKLLSSLTPCGYSLGDKEMAKLVSINFEIPRLENRFRTNLEARDALDDIIHKSLLFRRADGKIIGKDIFLPPPEKNANATGAGPSLHRYRSSGFELIHVTNESAVVSIHVHTIQQDGTIIIRRKTRNIRTFVMEASGWQCKLWVNFPVLEI